VTLSLALQTGIALTMVILHLYLLPSWPCLIAHSKRPCCWPCCWRQVYWADLGASGGDPGLLAATNLHPLVWLLCRRVCVIVVNATGGWSGRSRPTWLELTNRQISVLSQASQKAYQCSQEARKGALPDDDAIYPATFDPITYGHVTLLHVLRPCLKSSSCGL